MVGKGWKGYTRLEGLTRPGMVVYADSNERDRLLVVGRMCRVVGRKVWHSD